jgi:hypothetical protein
VAAKHPVARFGTVEVRAFLDDHAVTGATTEILSWPGRPSSSTRSSMLSETPECARP